MNVFGVIPEHDMTLVMGDLNAQIGLDNKGWEEVVGRKAVGERSKMES